MVEKQDIPKAEQPKSPLMRVLPKLLIFLGVVGGTALVLFGVVIPQFEAAAERGAKPIEAALMDPNFPSEYVRRFEELVHLYRGNYLTDGMAFERMKRKDGVIPDGLTVEEASNFMRDRIYALDLHFQTVWDKDQRRGGGLSPDVPMQQRTFRTTFVGDLAFMMEAFAKTHNIELSYTSPPTKRQRIFAVQQIQQIMAEETDNSKAGRAVATILDGLRESSAGLLACDVVDLQTPVILKDLNYFINEVLPVEDPYDFSETIQQLLRDRTRTARLNREVIKNMAGFCQSVAPDSWVSKEVVFPLVDAYLRAVQISMSEQVPEGLVQTFNPALDDYAFARRMADNEYLREAWMLVIRKAVPEFATHPVVQKELAALPALVQQTFGISLGAVPQNPAEFGSWADNLRAEVNQARDAQFKKTVEAFPSSARLSRAGFATGTPERALLDRVEAMEMVAKISLGAQGGGRPALQALRNAHKLLAPSGE